MKVAALGLGIVAFLLAGHDWVRRHGVSESLSFTWLYVVVSIVAAFWERGVIQPTADTSFVLYKGAVGNPNMLGSMMASSTPVVIWYLYRNWSNNKLRLLWGALLTTCIVVLYLANSRSAYIVFLSVVMGFLLAHGLRRHIAFAAAITVLGGFGVLHAPDSIQPFVDRNVYKYDKHLDDRGVFYTREAPWEESYSAAMEGAWIGVGYGASVGEDIFIADLTTVGYGREKGNAQLAIIEETGIIGLILYAALLVALFRELMKAALACRILEHRIVMGLFIGTLSGLLLQSVFEAWWVAPGAPEFAYFWAVAGTALGVARVIRSQSVTKRRRARTGFSPVRI